jgi:hypothetical protein
MRRGTTWVLLTAVLLGGLAGCGDSGQPVEAKRPPPSNRFPTPRGTTKKVGLLPSPPKQGRGEQDGSSGFRLAVHRPAL